MWKSPIEIAEEITKQIDMDLENGIIKAVQKVGIDVDKEELLKALQYDRGQYEKGYQDGLNANKWIPCSERLPKIEEEPSEYAKDVGRTFLVTYKDGFVCECVFWKNANKFDEDVVAWMPLPEPYKGEQHEIN